MTTQRWLLLVAIAAVVLAIVSQWPSREPRPIWDKTGEILSIEPPESARYVDPYDPDLPPGPSEDRGTR